MEGEKSTSDLSPPYVRNWLNTSAVVVACKISSGKLQWSWWRRKVSRLNFQDMRIFATAVRGEVRGLHISRGGLCKALTTEEGGLPRILQLNS